MTFEQTRAVLKIVKAEWPQSFRNMSREEGEARLDLWAETFRGDDVGLVKAAVEAIIETGEREFAPNAGQIKAQMRKLTGKHGRRGAGEAWQRAINAGKVKDAADELGTVSRYAREHGMSWKDAEKYLKEGLI